MCSVSLLVLRAGAFRLCWLAVVLVSWTALAQDSVLTYHNDNGRTGLNANENILSPKNVNSAQFGKLFSHKVDGYIYAQPLYLPLLALPGKGTRNVVFVATEGDSVYAFDADSSTGANASPLWHANLLDRAHGAPPGSTTVNIAKELRCDAVLLQVGITSTPVIDRASGTLFAVAYSKEAGSFVYRLHALDIATGAEKPPGPVALAAAVAGTGDGSVDGKLTFDALHELNRPGLLLLDGVIYLGFSSHCDRRPAHGWVLAYDASSLVLKDAFVTTPNGGHGGIWMSGAGLAADASGNVFLATGNGTTSDGGDIPATELSQSILKLTMRDDKLVLEDYFAPYNHTKLNRRDRDLGSGGVLLLPDQPESHPHLLVQAGKEAKIYLLDRDKMTANGQHICSANCTSDPDIVQEIPDGLNGMLFGTPAYWDGNIYFLAAMDTLRAFRMSDGKLGPQPVSVSKDRYDYPGANLSVSANGGTNGIVWALQSSNFVTHGPGVLRAYDASNVAHRLYSSDQHPQRDTPGGAVKFSVPTVIHGKVYVGAAGQLSVYGLLPHSPALKAHGGRTTQHPKRLSFRTQ